jgi:hypothetical protein
LGAALGVAGPAVGGSLGAMSELAPFPGINPRTGSKVRMRWNWISSARTMLPASKRQSVSENVFLVVIICGLDAPDGQYNASWSVTASIFTHSLTLVEESRQPDMATLTKDFTSNCVTIQVSRKRIILHHP